MALSELVWLISGGCGGVRCIGVVSFGLLGEALLSLLDLAEVVALIILLIVVLPGAVILLPGGLLVGGGLARCTGRALAV